MEVNFYYYLRVDDRYLVCVVFEKEAKIREELRMMGILPEVDNWAWFVTIMLVSVIPVIVSPLPSFRHYYVTVDLISHFFERYYIATVILSSLFYHFSSVATILFLVFSEYFSLYSLAILVR